jgi:hypothetical protein
MMMFQKGIILYFLCHYDSFSTAALLKQDWTKTNKISTSSSTTTSTRSLDRITFYRPSLVTSSDNYDTRVLDVPSLNSGLWSAANQTQAEKPFSNPPHGAGLEWVLNFTSPLGMLYTNFSNSNGIATLPTGDGYLAIAHGLTFNQCASHCANSADCAAWASYNVSTSNRETDLLCQYYSSGYSLGPQSWPSGNVLFAQGAKLDSQISTEDVIANGLRSGVWLGGLGTGGYEIRADGSFHLSTIRNQSPASEPWHGLVRDFVLAYSINGNAHVVKLSAFGGLPGVDQIVYSSRVPLARLEFANLTLYAYSTLTPGNVNGSNTPAVIYTLHVTCDNEQSSPIKITFAIFAGLGLRNDWRGVSSEAQPVPGISNRSTCAESCLLDPTCLSWQWEDPSTCMFDSKVLAQGFNSAGIESGHPGLFQVNGGGSSPVSIVFTNRNASNNTLQSHNAIGSQGLFTFPVQIDGTAMQSYYGASSGDSAEELLATLTEINPSLFLKDNLFQGSSSSTNLFAIASSTLLNLMPGSNASLSIAHVWHYPHFYWYRDTFGGSDNGVRYSLQFDSVYDIAASLNLTTLTQNLLAWQGVYSGLPDEVLSDAAFNLFAHSRSSMWFLRDEEYRQWESLEFTDFLNPTNGDERHLNYFSLSPAAMRSQLRTMVKHAQNADGMFYCVSVSCAGDTQFCSSDPCGPADHPDDIAMFVIGLYELYALANDTAIVNELYHAVILGLSYYEANYDSTPWHLPYQVHETYDAVPLSPTVTGEGNLGTSLYNSLNYLTALNCIAALADFMNDQASASQARVMLNRSTNSILENLWNPSSSVPSFIGDTLQDYALFTEPTNGFAFHSSDGLHGQVLAYRLGFGDLLPRTWMQLHQKFTTDDLLEKFGLSFSRYSHQNWIMSDHSNSALRLRWNDVNGWNTSISQINFWRNTRQEPTRHAAVFMANTGMYSLLNYYGYALFFYHTLNAYSGQIANLPNRSISFHPHYSAFVLSGEEATVPVLLGGCIGSLQISPTKADLTFAFLGEDAASTLSFTSISICQHSFTNGPFEFMKQGDSVTFILPTPCDSSSPLSANIIASAQYCKASPTANASTLMWSQQPLTQQISGFLREDCLSYVEAHHYCGYEYNSNTSTCTLVPGIACYLVESGPLPPTNMVERGYVHCDYSFSGYTPPQIINASNVTFMYNIGFKDSAPIDSPVYSVLLPDYDTCFSLAVSQQVCGFIWAPRYSGPQLGSCGPEALDSGCCVFNPSAPGHCVTGSTLDPSVWGDNVVLGIFGAQTT